MKLSPLYLVVNLAFAAGSAQAMTDADLKARVSARLDGDRTGACFAVAVIKKTVSRAYVCADPKDAARIGADPAVFRSRAEVVMMLVAAAAGALLLMLWRKPWAELGTAGDEARGRIEPTLAR